MKYWKRFACLAMLLGLLLSMALSVSAEDGGESGIVTGNAGSSGANVTWTLDLATGTMTLTPHTMGFVSGKMKDYSCYADTQTQARWYAYRPLIKTVIVEEGVVNIGNYAFFDCTMLESITLPSTVKKIGNGAFLHCSSLKSIVLPKELNSLGESVFVGCSSLTSLSVAEGNESFVSVNGALYDAEKRVLYAVPCGAESVNLPSTLKTIAPYAFSSCRRLQTLVIPPSVSTIGREAFSNCASLREIELPAYLTRIESGTFAHCLSLSTVRLPAALSHLAADAFWNCPSLRSFSLPSANECFAVCDGALYNKQQTALLLLPAAAETVTLSEQVKQIAPNAAMGCASLKTLALPSGLTDIGHGAFYGCTLLDQLTMADPTAPVTLGYGAFALCEQLCDGDVNDSGETDVLDLLALARAIENGSFTLPQLLASDADGNGRVDANDLIAHLKAIAAGKR